MPLLDEILAEKGQTRADINKNSSLGKLFRRNGVRDTPELHRVMRLPRRRWDVGLGGVYSNPNDLALVLTEIYKRDGGKMVLRPVQAAALADMHDFGGLLAPVSVGQGKTLCSFLAPKVLGSVRPLLLIPAKLRDKTQREWLALQEHWVLPQILIESYERISNNADLLLRYSPDLIVADECHRLKNLPRAVTRRVKRYVEQFPETIFVGLSGTITRRSLHDYWHLMRWALGDSMMPLPSRWEELTEWAECLDVGGTGGTAPGALIHLCNDQEKEELRYGMEAALAAVRKAYQRRLVETPGVISTVGSDFQIDCSLSISQVEVDLDHLGEYFLKLRGKAETPDGHPVIEAVDFWRHARELVCGFYYRWVIRPPEAWMIARRRWAKFVRETMKKSHYDTELMVSNACKKFYDDPKQGVNPFVTEPVIGQNERGELVTTMEHIDCYAAWNNIKDTFEPETEAVWISDTVLNYATEWLKNNVGIVWVEHQAFGQKLEELSGYKYYGQGGLSKDGSNIEDEQGPCIASIRANGEGRNLQRYNTALVVSCPPSGGTWEQMLGRMHRPGQTADEVNYQVILGCREAIIGFHNALRDARFIQDTMGQSQKLLYADVSAMSLTDMSMKKGVLWERNPWIDQDGDLRNEDGKL